MNNSGEEAADNRLEFAHVLFLDLVGYSAMLMDHQREYLGRLQRIVQGTAEYSAAEKRKELIALPTGDGMALVFFGDPTAAAGCAASIARALKAEPQLKLRMGLHSGPVYRVADVNQNMNVSGGGINIAQRVMDAGDSGHILVSSAVADVLSQLGSWNKYLVDLGEHPVKHGVKIHFYNLCSDGVGNPAIPAKWSAAEAKPSHKGRWLAAVAALVLTGALYGAFIWSQSTRRPRLELDYSIRVQRYKDKQPYRDPFQLGGEMLFEEDHHIAVVVSSPEAGYLYILNDGPLEDGSPSISVLYPAANAEALLPARKTVRIPEKGWIVFDRATGAEKLYLAWSANPRPELEEVKNMTGSMQRGQVVIKDASQLASLRQLLTDFLTPRTNVHRDEAAKRTIVRSSRVMLVHMLRLEHH